MEKPHSNPYIWYFLTYPNKTPKDYQKNKKSIQQEHAQRTIDYWWYKANQDSQ